MPQQTCRGLILGRCPEEAMCSARGSGDFPIQHTQQEEFNERILGIPATPDYKTAEHVGESLCATLLLGHPKAHNTCPCSAQPAPTGTHRRCSKDSPMVFGLESRALKSVRRPPTASATVAFIGVGGTFRFTVKASEWGPASYCRVPWASTSKTKRGWSPACLSVSFYPQLLRVFPAPFIILI